MKDAIEIVSEVFELRGKGEVINPPRQQIDLPQGYLRITSAIVGPMQKIAVKVSSSMIFKNTSGRVLILIDSKCGKIEALIEVFYLGALRTGAASGVATKLLSKKDAKTVGIFGSGRQARTQLLAIASVRPIEKIIATSPNADHLREFCSEMTENLRISVLPAKSPKELYSCDILISATTSKEPVILGKYLQPGIHINAIGANRQERKELDEEVIKRCSTIIVDNKEQAKKESSALICAIDNGVISWEDVKEMGEFMIGKFNGRPTPESITLYNSHGIAMEDVAVASKAYELALKKGIGIEIPFSEN